MPHGKICYLEIPAKTAQASADFYSRIFGWKVRKRGDGELAFDDTGGVSGTWVKEADRTPDERTRTYIMVDVIADTLQQIVAAGGRVLTPRTEIGPGMGAFAHSRIRSATSSGCTRDQAAERARAEGSGSLRLSRRGLACLELRSRSH
jgi:hypothetical protein